MTDDDAKDIIEGLIKWASTEGFKDDIEAMRHALVAIEDRAALVAALYGVAPTTRVLDALLPARRHMEGK